MTDVNWWQILFNLVGWVGGFILGHYLTKREYEYDYRKNTEKQFETLDGLKKWQQLEDKKAIKDQRVKDALKILKEEKKNADNVPTV